MPECDNEWAVVENREEKRCQVNRGDDPESFFELKLCRLHVRILAAGLSAATQNKMKVSAPNDEWSEWDERHGR